MSNLNRAFKNMPKINTESSDRDSRKATKENEFFKSGRSDNLKQNIDQTRFNLNACKPHNDVKIKTEKFDN